jgi:hypothetical protein
MVRGIALLILVSSVGGCATAILPGSVAERQSGYTYVPIDPFPVQTVPGDGCDGTRGGQAQLRGTLLQSLPDNSVRMLVERFDASGTVTWPRQTGGERGVIQGNG